MTDRALCRREYQPPGGQLQGASHQAALARSKFSNLEDQLAPYEGVANLLSESEGSQEREASRQQQQLAGPRPEKRSRGSRRVHFTDEAGAQVVSLRLSAFLKRSLISGSMNAPTGREPVARLAAFHACQWSLNQSLRGCQQQK